jgi:hypothetical protein
MSASKNAQPKVSAESAIRRVFLFLKLARQHEGKPRNRVNPDRPTELIADGEFPSGEFMVKDMAKLLDLGLGQAVEATRALQRAGCVEIASTWTREGERFEKWRWVEGSKAPHGVQTSALGE